MSRRTVTPAFSPLLLGLAVTAAAAEAEPSAGAGSAVRVTPSASVIAYGVNQYNSYFGDTSSHFVDTIVRAGATAALPHDLSGTVQISAQASLGDPADLTGVTTDDWQVEAELVNLTAANLFGAPLSLTVGKQDLSYGDGFLVFDGVHDSRAAWFNPVRSFTAAKAVYEKGILQAGAFAAIVDQDYTSYEVYLLDGTLPAGLQRVIRYAIERAGAQHGPSGDSVRGVDILMIEPSITDTRLAHEAFREAKLLNTLRVAASAADALAFLLRREPYATAPTPDIILLNPNLPGESAMDFIAAVREHPALRHVPIVILTGSEVEEDILKPVVAGACGYANKPVDLTQLSRIVQSVDDLWIAAVRRPGSQRMEAP